MRICYNCKTQLVEGAKFCPICGKSTNNLTNGVLTIRWDGNWMLFDAKIHLRVDGTQIGSYSFKKGFVATVPITSNTMLVDVKCWFRSYQPVLRMNPLEDHTLYLMYSRITGGFDFMLCDKNGKRIQ